MSPSRLMLAVARLGLQTDTTRVVMWFVARRTSYS
jgi:hypothetical protein